MKPTSVSVILVVFTLGLVGCEREHEAASSVREFLDALQYGDGDGLFARHVDSTHQSTWCSEGFRAALEKAQRESGTEECSRLRALSASDLEELRDEVRLAVQVAAWACEHREGSCRDYSETVFRQALKEHPLFEERPTGYQIRRVFGDETTAVAYVDLTLADGTREHRTLELREVDTDWRVVKGFLDR